MSGKDASSSPAVIDLSSDDECQIVDLEEEEKVRKTKSSLLVNDLKADLSQIRNFSPQKKPSSSIAVANINDPKTPHASGSGRVNGATGTTRKDSSIEEVILVGDEDDDFEIEYGDGDEDGVDGRNGTGVDDEDLQIVESVSEVGSSASSSTKLNGSAGTNGEEGPVSEPEPEGDEEDNEGGSDEDDNVYVKRSEDLITAFGKQFRLSKKPGNKLSEIEKGKSKVWDAYNKIKDLPRAVHIRLQEKLQHAINSLEVNPKNLWTIIKHLLDTMKPDEIAKIADLPVNVRKQIREEQKQKLLQQAEQQLKKIQKKIRELEEAEVDWDDEENDHNSPYILTEKYKKKLIDAYYTICDICKCSHLTGRPIQKTIKLGKHGANSEYVDVDLAVEKFVNKGGFLFIPDFYDVHGIVKKVNEAKALGLRADEMSRLAQKIFENVVRIIKMRRHKDFKMSMLCHLPTIRNLDPSPSSNGNNEEDADLLRIEERLQDPAEDDVDLKRKLEENEALKKSEDEVIEEFVKRAQEQGRQAREVAEGENLDGSPPPSDTENGGEDRDGEEEDDVDDRLHQEHEHAELTEDEDEEAELVSITISPDGNLEENDDTSNEGRTTAAESVESDSNANAADSVDKKDDSSVPNGNGKGPVKRKNSETEETSVPSPENLELQLPPSKRVKSDENSNEPASVTDTKEDGSVVDETMDNGNAQSVESSSSGTK